MSTRRSFVKKAGAGLLAMGASSAIFSEELFAAADPVKKTSKEDLFQVSMAGYTFRNFDIDKTIEYLKRVNVNYLCIKDFHLPLTSTKEECDAFHAKLKSSQQT